MLIVKTEPLELRGVKNETSRKGNVYQVLNCESHVGEHFAFYCPDSSILPSGMKKGDMVVLSLNVREYKGKKDFFVSHVEHLKNN